jgi:catechol 2,3-dioxygenase-like lactoylglutathione lyase family enzyme
MIDHIALTVSDYERSRDFYKEVLAALGYELLMEHGISGAGFGRDGKPDFWIQAGEASGPIHVAFATADRAAVSDFHAAAVGAGAQGNGDPGLRPEYHPNYYGAFVLDPDGNNLEAVCHLPEFAETVDKLINDVESEAVR